MHTGQPYDPFQAIVRSGGAEVRGIDRFKITRSHQDNCYKNIAVKTSPVGRAVLHQAREPGAGNTVNLAPHTATAAAVIDCFKRLALRCGEQVKVLQLKRALQFDLKLEINSKKVQQVLHLLYAHGNTVDGPVSRSARDEIAGLLYPSLEGRQIASIQRHNEKLAGGCHPKQRQRPKTMPSKPSREGVHSAPQRRTIYETRGVGRSEVMRRETEALGGPVCPGSFGQPRRNF